MFKSTSDSFTFIIHKNGNYHCNILVTRDLIVSINIRVFLWPRLWLTLVFSASTGKNKINILYSYMRQQLEYNSDYICLFHDYLF